MSDPTDSTDSPASDRPENEKRSDASVPEPPKTEKLRDLSGPVPPKTEQLEEEKPSTEELEIAEELARESDRRAFLQKAGSVVIGGAIVAGPTVVAVRAVLDPLTRGGQGGVLARLTSLDALVPGAPPQVFKVIADKTDAWTTYKDLPLGMVYAQRSEDGELTVFSATCPHLGCVVEFRNTEEHGEQFYCPCHESSFKVDGSLAPNNTQAKRGLDTLEIDQEKLAAGEVWVRFQKFKANIVEKKAVS